MEVNEITTKLADTDELARREEVAGRAYRLWQERGSPLGSPDEDWFRAEQEISSEHSGLKAA